MQRSPGFDRIRNKFEKTGCSSGAYENDSLSAWSDTLVNPFTADWGAAPAQVGGYMTQATNNGDGTVTYEIQNHAGAHSFFYHAVSDRTSSTGPFRTINQNFTFTEVVPGGCR